MFKDPFSFDGRIRRTEFGISAIIYIVALAIIRTVIQSENRWIILALTYIPVLWFAFAQGAKRCHDIGNSGWYQIIPFYSFWMLFADSVKGTNEYGENPKGVLNQESENAIHQSKTLSLISKNIKELLLKRFIELSQGIQRLLILVSILTALLLPFKLGAHYPNDLDDMDYWGKVPMVFLIFWIIARAIVWVYDGFIKTKE